MTVFRYDISIDMTIAALKYNPLPVWVYRCVFEQCVEVYSDVIRSRNCVFHIELYKMSLEL